MIVTLTLNPSLDRTLEVDRLRRGGVTRASSVHFDPGGKGVNVTRALRAFGVASCAVIPCGGPDGGELVRMLGEAGVPVVAVPVGGRTRSNVTLVESGGRSTKVNAPGDPLTEEELAALADAVLDACGADGSAGDEGPTASWVVLCGSLPPGVPDGVYASLTALFAAHGVRVAVDTSGPALSLAVAAGPDLVKPNREELAAAAGRPLRSLRDVVEAAGELRDAGAGAVLASLGPDGAVLVDAKGAVFCTADAVEPRSTVGRGRAAGRVPGRRRRRARRIGRGRGLGPGRGRAARQPDAGAGGRAPERDQGPAGVRRGAGTHRTVGLGRLTADVYG